MEEERSRSDEPSISRSDSSCHTVHPPSLSRRLSSQDLFLHVWYHTWCVGRGSSGDGWDRE
jgi:hypothetical protein